MRVGCALLLLLHGPAWAYEDENAVPLAVEAVPGKLRVEQVAVRINGREVSVTTRLRNGQSTAQTMGFFAHTPIFRRLGAGEMHADKSFADLQVGIAGQAMFKPAANRRGFFMGQDITAALAKAGLPPLPDPDVHWKKLRRVKFPHGIKADDWQGYVSYSWVHTLAPGQYADSTLRYQALPEFTRDDVGSARFARLVQRHCGDPAAAARLLRQQGAPDGAVQIERFDLPLRMDGTAQHTLEVIQPKKNWMGVHPVLALACGLETAPAGASFTSQLTDTSEPLSVLVISRLSAN